MGLRTQLEMPSDFWAGYISGAVGICVGNPLDVIKVQLQAGPQLSIVSPNASQFRTATGLLKGMLLFTTFFVLWSDVVSLEQVQQRPFWHMVLSTPCCL